MNASVFHTAFSRAPGACRAGLLAAALLAASPAGAGAGAAAVEADMVFRNGAVYTVDGARPWAQAVAIKGEKIVYVGAEDGLAAFQGKHTRVVDMHGGMLLPGFIDSHTHLTSSETLLDVGLTLRERPYQDVVEALRQYTVAHPEKPLIYGGGWIMEAFPESGPTRQMIDAFESRRPVVLKALDGHHTWVNSKTLELAGIDRNTPDPLPGKSWFQRDPKTNEPTGFIIEHAAYAIVQKNLEAKGYHYVDTHERVEEGLHMGIPELARNGITTVLDCGMGTHQEEVLGVLREMEKQDKLGVRVVATYRTRPPMPVPNDDAVARLQDLRARYHSDLLSVRLIKIYLDGTETNHTAYMIEPYADQPDHRGSPLVSQEELDDIVQKADAAGIDMTMHVVGDAGIRLGLNAVEYAEKINGPRDRRHSLTHTILVEPSDIPRFRKDNVIWQTTPYWAMMNDRNRTVERHMGAERFAREIYPMRDAVDQGVVLTSGSDMATMATGGIWRPLENIQVGHTRLPLDNANARVMPREDQRVSLPDLIRSYTINGAYMLRLEHETGSIEVGKKADMVVLERNLFDVAPQEISKTRVLYTLLDGKVTYQQPPAAAGAGR